MARHPTCIGSALLCPLRQRRIIDFHVAVPEVGQDHRVRAGSDAAAALRDHRTVLHAHHREHPRSAPGGRTVDAGRGQALLSTAIGAASCSRPDQQGSTK